VGLVVDKVALVYDFAEYFAFPANSQSIDCSALIIYHAG
jgi:hypothetical protein